MYDARLVGTWQSDKRRTARDVAARRDISPKNRRIIIDMFGHLRLRYTRTRCYSHFRGDRESWSYTVLAKASDSVVIANSAADSGSEPSLRHIHFDSMGAHPKVYWICLGSFREFFRRVKAPSNTALQLTRRGKV